MCPPLFISLPQGLQPFSWSVLDQSRFHVFPTSAASFRTRQRLNQDPIVIPTAKSVQKTLKKKSSKAEHVPATKVLVITENGSTGLGSAKIGQSSTLQTELREALRMLQSNRSRQSSLLQSLEDLLKADLEALQAGKPPPAVVDVNKRSDSSPKQIQPATE